MNIKKRSKIIIAVLIIISALVLVRFTGPERDSISFPERLAQDFFAPFQSASTGIIDWAVGLPLYFGQVQEVIDENAALHKELVVLQEEVARLSAAYIENVRLKDLLNISDTMSAWTPVSAKIIARSYDDWYRSVTISGGANKGFAKDMAVITSEGLVGRITAVSEYTSEVLLLLDTNCTVSGLIMECNTYGVVEAMDDSQTVLEMVHIPYDAHLETGQAVISSGLGEVFPAGLRVGYIAGFSSDEGGLMQKATVIPYVDFERLTEVLVLTSSRGEADYD